MEKTVNLTIRIEPKLKKDAEEACAYLDKTLSAYLRGCMRDLIRQHHRVRAQDSAYHRSFMEGEYAQAAVDALAREVERGKAEIEPPAPAPISQAPAKPELPKVQVSQVRPQREEPGDIKLLDNGEIDPRTMSRKLRRAWERDKAKGRI